MKEKNFSFKLIFNIYNLIAFIISGLISTGAFLLIYFLKECTLVARLDGLFVGCVISFAIGTFSILTHFGAFDILAVGFINFFATYQKDPTARSIDVYDYQMKKYDKRKASSLRFISYYLVALIFLIIFLVFYL